jgi:hypothetical protein
MSIINISHSKDGEIWYFSQFFKQHHRREKDIHVKVDDQIKASLSIGKKSNEPLCMVC